MRFVFLLLCIASFSFAGAQVPVYYQFVDFNLNGNALKKELSQLISDTHLHELQYTPDIWNALKQADVDTADSSKVLLIYGYNDTDAATANDRTRARNASCHTSNCNGKWVREHVFPRSKGTPNLEFEGPGSDAHHLHAVDYDRNGMRSNYKFIENPASYITYSRIIKQNGIDYFYPGDEWKGDVARMIMYMYLRYENRCLPVNVGAGSVSFSPNADMPDVFLKWNAEDPVSLHEMNRNEQIYNAQGNRNPFIDNPYLATKIWNGPMAENKWKTLENENDPVFNRFKVYPTITDTYLNVETGTEEYAFKILDTSGKLVYTGNNVQTIDVTKFSNGLYLLVATVSGRSRTFKFIKK